MAAAPSFYTLKSQVPLGQGQALAFVVSDPSSPLFGKPNPFFTQG